jgi:hypothetical protein
VVGQEIKMFRGHHLQIIKRNQETISKRVKLSKRQQRRHQRLLGYLQEAKIQKMYGCSLRMRQVLIGDF